MSTPNQSERNAFGEYVRNRRLDLGLTQEELAEQSGIGQETISSIERGQGSFPRLRTLKKLAAGLGVDLSKCIDLLDMNYTTARADSRSGIAVKRPVSAQRAKSWETMTETQIRDLFPDLTREDAEVVTRLISHLISTRSRRWIED